MYCPAVKCSQKQLAYMQVGSPLFGSRAIRGCFALRTKPVPANVCCWPWLCENSTRYNRTRNFGLYGHAESKKTQKFVFRSALRPNQISFSHGQDPKATSRLSGAPLADNFTVLGLIANLIVVLGRPPGHCGYGYDINQEQAVQPGLARRHQLPARRRPRRAGTLPKRVPGHPAALEPIRSRIGDYDKWHTRACRPNADRRAIDETRAKRGSSLFA
jgi:hypothetical protein